MKIKSIISLIATAMLAAAPLAPAQEATPPPSAGQEETLPMIMISTPEKDCPAIHDPVGRAGMSAALSGQSRDILMVGGANFPKAAKDAKTPEERGPKTFYRDIALWTPAGKEEGKEAPAPAVVGELPYEVAYAACVSTADGMILAGGCNAEGHLGAVTALHRNADGSVTAESLPDLPVPSAYAAFAEAEGKWYVMGGQENASSTTALNRCFVLDLGNPAEGWKEIAPMPGEGRILATAGYAGGRIYVAGGCSLKPNANKEAERTYLDTVLSYDPASDKWEELSGKMPQTLVGSANPMPVLNGKLFVFGGDPGEFYRKSLEGNAPKKHPGQSKLVYSFDPATGTWTKEGENGIGVATCPVVAVGDTLYVISGEIKPGVRTPAISTVSLRQLKSYPAISFLSGLTPWAALVVAVLAILFAIRKGVTLKSVSNAVTQGNPGKWAWIAVGVLWFVVMLNYFDRQLLAVLNTSITSGENGIPMTQAQFGLVTSAFLIVYAVLSPVGGYLADRFSRKFIILCSLVVWSLVTWLTGAASSYTELLIARAAMGVSEAFYIPAALALITDYHRGKTRSMATGLHMSGIYAGQMLAGCGALMACEPYMLGWRLTFEAFGFIGVAYAIIVVLFLHDPESPATPGEASDDADEEEAVAAGAKAAETAAAPNFTIMDVLRNLFTGRAFALLLVIYAFAGFANWFLMGWYPRLLQDMFGISESDAGPQATFWINIAKYIAVLGGAVVADLWYARNRNARAYVPGICFCVAGPCVIIAMLPSLGVPIVIGLSATLALVSMQGVAQGSLDATLMPILRSHIDERFSATGYGLLNLTSVSAGALISWLGGYLKDADVSLGVPLSIAGMLMVLCGAFFFLLPRKQA